MRYMNEIHHQFVQECVEKAKNNDCYHLSLFYILGLTQDCRNHIDSLYNWQDGCVRQIIGENYGWITGTDVCIIRLAYNMYNNGAPTAFDIDNLEDKNSELMNYLPTAIFGGLSPDLMKYCFKGIKIRYELE